jgi:hypothetical protein
VRDEWAISEQKAVGDDIALLHSLTSKPIWANILPPATVDAYEALYFNVREKIQHPAYIYHAIFGDGPRRALTDNDPALLKMYGYILGPHVLSAVESGFAGASWCSSIANCTASPARSIRSNSSPLPGAYPAVNAR